MLYATYTFSVRLGSAKTHVCVLAVFFFFFFFFEPKCLTFFVNSERCALFINLQILLFNNFFIKNGSHSAIYTFKNYFAIVFFSFQFLAISKRTVTAELHFSQHLSIYFIRHPSRIGYVICFGIFKCNK